MFGLMLDIFMIPCVAAMAFTIGAGTENILTWPGLVLCSLGLVLSLISRHMGVK